MIDIERIRRALKRDAKANWDSTESPELALFNDLVRHIEQTRERLHDAYHEGPLSGCTKESCSDSLYLLTRVSY